MNQKDSIFGAEPDRIRQLIRSGMDIADADVEENPPARAHVGGLMERPGTRIGCYKLLRVLGEGGMGMVYLAEQVQLIRRRVALKIIKPGMDSKRVLARFEAERQALALLDHPNIAQVHDAGTADSGRPYFAMEYVKGTPITEFCDRHTLSIEQRLRLFQQVCGALQHAHQKGIIHRDIKPSNILVSSENDQIVPKIIDFGVAKAISQPLTERTLITEDSQLLGTPEYMSPEQVELANEDIDTRSDIYSLGVLLYELLIGVLPFDSETLRGGGVEHIRKVIRETDPKTPSTRLTKLGDEAKQVAEKRRTEIAALAKCLHRELEWIPLKAMRKERSERYRSASELADDIENYLKGDPLMAGPLTAGYRLKKFLRRHKAVVGAMAAVLVVSVIGAIVSVYFALGQANALAQNEAMVEFLNRDILDQLGQESFKPASMRKVFDAASEKLAGTFTDYPLLEAAVRFRFGKIYGWQLGVPDAALPNLERAVELNQRETGRRPSSPMNYLALAYMKAGKYQETEAMYRKMIESIETNHKQGTTKPSPFYYAIKSHLGNAWRLMGRYDEAEPYIHEAPLHPWWNDGHWREFLYEGRIAALLRDQGRYEEAGQLYEELLRNRRRSQDQEDSEIMKELGILYTLRGKLDKAAPLIEGALAGAQKEFGVEHWTTMDIKIALAVLRTKQGDHDEAEPLFNEALRNIQARLDDDHPSVLEAKSQLGVLYREQERCDEAEKLLQEVLQGQDEKLGSDHPATLQTTHELAVLYKGQDRYQEAEDLLLPALKGRRLKLGDTHPHTVESWKTLIELYEAWGKPEKAEEWHMSLKLGREEVKKSRNLETP